MRSRFARGVLLPVCAALVVVAPALGCTVPVFRYALDRWVATAYELRSDFEVPAGIANLECRAGRSGKHELFAPFDRDNPIWSGELDGEKFAALVDSPQRKEIARRILAGDAAVWVLVESGDAQADQEVFERLDDRLTFFQSVAELPEIDPDDPSSQLGPGPELGLKFSILRLRRDDPAEALLVKMLAGPKADKLPAGEPFVAPVFGQGRVLGAWSGETMDAEGIEEASFYLTGACSCQVKSQNPGWDLLLAVDWKKQLLAAERERGPKPERTEKPDPESTKK